MNYGNLNRRWQETKPETYDKENRIVRMDIIAERRPDMRTDTNSSKQTMIDGWSYIEVHIDEQIDYGHIKSQLIEAGFAQKDEFGLLMNAVDDILKAITDNSTISSIKEALNTEDVNAFYEFCQFRNMCAEAAKEVMKHY